MTGAAGCSAYPVNYPSYLRAPRVRINAINLTRHIKATIVAYAVNKGGPAKCQ